MLVIEYKDLGLFIILGQKEGERYNNKKQMVGS